MIVVMQPDAGEAAIAAVEAKIRAEGLGVHVSRGTERTLIGAIGDERKLDARDVRDAARRRARAAHPEALQARRARVAQGEHRRATYAACAIGGDAVQMIAGPCSVETAPQMDAAAAAVAAGGARLMRGGAFKPRTSPYAFQGAGVEGLDAAEGRRRAPRPADRHRTDGRAHARHVPARRRST